MSTHPPPNLPLRAQAQLLRQARQALTPRYLEPHRRYHGLAHVRALLAGLRTHRALVHDRLAVGLSIWFHDAVYDSTQSDNELRSALLAERVLGHAWGAPRSLVDKVMAQVMATQGHRWEDGDPDTALFLDLDLSVLGQPWPRYQAYLQSVREEYRWVPEDLYAQRRVQVLQTFLQRPRLYFTDALSARYESEARANLAREIGQLQAIRAG